MFQLQDAVVKGERPSLEHPSFQSSPATLKTLIAQVTLLFSRFVPQIYLSVRTFEMLYVNSLCLWYVHPRHGMLILLVGLPRSKYITLPYRWHSHATSMISLVIWSVYVGTGRSPEPGVTGGNKGAWSLFCGALECITAEIFMRPETPTVYLIL